jgi:hypothetical protein
MLRTMSVTHAVLEMSGCGASVRRGQCAGVLAVFGDSEGEALLLLVDLGVVGRNDGMSLTNGMDQYLRAAHAYLVAPAGRALDNIRIVQIDTMGAFDFYMRVDELTARGFYPIMPLNDVGSTPPRSRAAFLQWTGGVGRAVLGAAEHWLSRTTSFTSLAGS